MSGVYRYVIHEMVEVYLARGWIFRTHLGPWSSLMRACICNPEGNVPCLNE